MGGKPQAQSKKPPANYGMMGMTIEQEYEMKA